MALPTLLRRWSGRIDTDRVTTFARFLLRRFIDDRCFESAGALAYTTVFALVPLSAVLFAVLAVFPVFDAWTLRLLDLVFANFVPTAAQAVAGGLQDLAASARQLPLTGLAVLLASLLLTLLAIERTFDRIWRVRRPRSTLWRLLLYWTVLTFGALLAAASLAASLWLFGTDTAGGLALMPGLLAFLVFSAAYWLVPNRPVPLRFALAGGLLAALLFEAAKAGFTAYLRNTSFEELYGALAVIPIFLAWVWLSWAVVLLGASLAASLGAFRYQPRAQRLPPGAELYACLRLLARLEASRRDGRGLDAETLRRLEPALTDELCQRLLEGLAGLDIARRSEDGRWSPVRDLAGVSLRELHENLGLRVPALDLPLPAAEDAIGQAALAALRHLRQALDVALQRPVAEFIGPQPDAPA